MNGTIGLDFFTFSRENFGLVYFVEVGYSFNSAEAEKLERQPHYANGADGCYGAQVSPMMDFHSRSLGYSGAKRNKVADVSYQQLDRGLTFYQINQNVKI